MENNPVMRLIQRLPADGTIIIYREYTSTDGSPAVDIGIKKLCRPSWIDNLVIKIT
jgi:hypothetical protein